MSDLAKKARAAMKSKAERLGKTTTQKVDSSTWTPAEELNADVKTGLRPISRRAYKKGGKVMGEACEARADRKPRKNGGKAEYKAEASEFAKAKINRNVKAANEEREGKKHIGGMKSGGSAKRKAFDQMLGASQKKVRDFGGSDISDTKLGRGLMKYAPSQYVSNLAKDKGEKDPMTGMKKGGRTGKNEGGMSSGRGILTKGGKDVVGPTSMPATEEKKAPPIPQRPQREPEKGMSGAEATEFMKARKAGGRAKKADGGAEAFGPGIAGAAKMMKKAGVAGVPGGGIYGAGFTRVGAGKLSPAGAAMPMSRMKKGGKAEAKEESYNALRAKGGTQVMGSYKKGGEAKHPDEAMDKALIKKMVKPSARTGKADGGDADMGMGKRTDRPQNISQPQFNEAAVDKAISTSRQKIGKGEGKAIKSLLGGWQDRVKRTGRATGGRTKPKGKTNINIIIASGKPAGDKDMMGQPPGGIPTDNRGAGGIPIPVSQPPGGAAGMPGGGMPIPMPIPMPAAGGPPAPAGGMPMGRKDGGRITKVAKSYKDMQAGAASGEGRLQKTDIAKKQPKPGFQKGDNVYTGLGYPNKVPGATGGRTAKKAGGRTYRSYKDMDAGAGSGLGRLEKTEIASRKH
jgi:hypothetical protein